MPDGRDAPTIKILPAVSDVAAADWDACAGSDNPFVSHAFLSALEDCGSVTPDSGWLPQHLVMEDEAGRVLACAPAYLKGHSYGEFVFDWSWADAYQRTGQAYYPKLLCAVPFTPVTGPRLMVRPEAPADFADILGAGLVRLAETRDLSSVHANFLPGESQDTLARLGFLPRLDIQYHWANDGYDAFEDFLAALSSRKRKALRKERREVAETDVEIRTLVGPEISEKEWDAFHHFYLSTSDKKWGPSYLNRRFFSLLGERLGERVVLVMAFRKSRPVAGALNLCGADTLYGRNWGCLEEVKFLHFEVCYYRAIDYAIETGLTRVEAGAQGRHKIQRGYLPSFTRSAHWIADPRFRDAIAHYLEAERKDVTEHLRELNAQSPFKKA